MTARPRITVAIPNFNTAHRLPSAIASVLAQRFQDFELLVLDNASTDDTPAVVARYDDPRIVFHVNERNLGFAGNVHLGCRMARGDYVVVMGTDDILCPDFLGEAVAMLDAEPGCPMVHGPAAWIDMQGRRYGYSEPGWARITPGRDAMLGAFRTGFCFTTMVLRTAAIRATGNFDERWLEVIDLWLFCRMCLAGDIGYLDKVLVEYRVHPTAMSAVMGRSNLMFRRQLAAAREAFAWPETRALGAAHHLREAELHCARLAIDVLHTGRGDGYRRYFANLAEIVREVPAVLLRPATWARIGFGMLPVPAIEAFSRLRARRAAARETARQTTG
jgi:glycosyltransferase involved in cell wall biosynthesis